MCECLYRARERKIGHKNVASAPTFSLSIGDVCWQTTALDHLSQYFTGGLMPEELVLCNTGEHPVCYSRSTVYGTSCVATIKVDEQRTHVRREGDAIHRSASNTSKLAIRAQAGPCPRAIAEDARRAC